MGHGVSVALTMCALAAAVVGGAVLRPKPMQLSGPKAAAEPVSLSVGEGACPHAV